MQTLLRRARVTSQWAAALSLALAAGRMVWVSASEKAPEVVQRVQDVVEHARVQHTDAVAGNAAPPVAAPGTLTGTPIRVMVLVKHADSRTQVLINGAYVGNAPYAGDISCVPGETLVFGIVAPGAEPIVRKRKCSEPTLTLSE
jgi:ApbE superfamily uncharacterized protein (UPF0280 family)